MAAAVLGIATLALPVEESVSVEDSCSIWWEHMSKDMRSHTMLEQFH